MHESKIIDIYMKLRHISRQMRCHNYIINKTVFVIKTWNNHRQHYVSLFIDNHGGMLLLITKICHTVQIDLIYANGLTPSAAKEILRLRGSSLK